MTNQLPMRVECMTPILSVKDMKVSRAFYVGLLGFKEAEWGDDIFTSVGTDKGSVYLCQGAQGNAGTWVWVGFDGDIYALRDALTAKGVTIRQPPRNYPYAIEMHVEDPDGHVLRFGTDPDPNQPFVDWQG